MNHYQAECVKLESTSWHEPNRRLLHAAMGLVTEGAELLDYVDDANFLEELGDIMWYVAVGCDVLEVTIHEAVEHSPGDRLIHLDPVGRIVLNAGDILDALKKSIFYGRAYDPNRIVALLGEITLCVSELADSIGKTLEDVEVANLAKLHKRYKGGTFSEEAANNRDVKEEMTVYS